MGTSTASGIGGMKQPRKQGKAKGSLVGGKGREKTAKPAKTDSAKSSSNRGISK